MFGSGNGGGRIFLEFFEGDFLKGKGNFFLYKFTGIFFMGWGILYFRVWVWGGNLGVVFIGVEISFDL